MREHNPNRKSSFSIWKTELLRLTRVAITVLVVKAIIETNQPLLQTIAVLAVVTIVFVAVDMLCEIKQENKDTDIDIEERQ